MKAWSVRGAAADPSPVVVDPASRVRGIDALLRQGARFWRAAGARRPRVCQFLVEGAADRSWFIAVDESGGRARLGVHQTPDVVWESDDEALEALFRGSVLQGRVRVRGDFELIRETFLALAAA